MALHKYQIVVMTMLFGATGIAAATIHRNPGLKRLWDNHGKARYHIPDEIPFQRWRVLVDDRLDEFTIFEPVPLRNFARCGLN